MFNEIANDKIHAQWCRNVYSKTDAVYLSNVSTHCIHLVSSFQFHQDAIHCGRKHYLLLSELKWQQGKRVLYRVAPRIPLRSPVFHTSFILSRYGWYRTYICAYVGIAWTEYAQHLCYIKRYSLKSVRMPGPGEFHYQQGDRWTWLLFSLPPPSAKVKQMSWTSVGGGGFHLNDVKGKERQRNYNINRKPWRAYWCHGFQYVDSALVSWMHVAHTFHFKAGGMIRMLKNPQWR